MSDARLGGDLRRDGRPGWDPESDAEFIAGLAEHIPTVEDEAERWGLEEFLALCRARQRRYCGRRWPEEHE